ncbi:MAG: DMT family transporter [Propionibacteriaceae bacterium]|jgi:drug/metabolite transporter (DMT)-like permease|nr:DMT family transporter [Propionibacteriaceae bacterium]
MAEPAGGTGISAGRRVAPWSLMILAILWGSTFFSIKRVLTVLPVTDFLAVRFLISTLLLVAVFHRHLKMRREVWLRGTLLGVLWATAQLLQTAGLARTSAALSGFVTGLYVVFTPILGLLLFRLRVSRWVWVAVGLATAGLAALTLRPAAGLIGAGELLTIGCAIVYGLHIAVLGRWSNPRDAAGLTLAQAFAMTVVFIVAALPGGITLPPTGIDWAWMAYLAVPCGAVALLVQTWAQGHLDASKAAVIMCSEPLWATFFAILFGGERPNWLFAVGAAAILAAMYLVIRPPGQSRETSLSLPTPTPAQPRH